MRRIVETVDVKGEKAIRWYVDPDEAKVALIVAQIMSPFTELHLSVTSLGHAYALAEGWTAADLEFPLRIVMRTAAPLVCMHKACFSFASSIGVTLVTVSLMIAFSSSGKLFEMVSFVNCR